MPTLPSVQERLAEARLAYHLLLTGQQEVEVRDANGESVRFTAANASRLRAYISELEDELTGNIGALVRRPLRPVWS